MGYTPDLVAGTSAGAIAGALYVARRHERIARYAETLTSRDLWREPAVGFLTWPARLHRLRTRRGLLDAAKLRELVERELPDSILTALHPDSLQVHAIDILTGRRLVYRAGDPPHRLREGILGSAALPFALPPVPSTDPQGRPVVLRDGGITVNHPAVSAVIAAWQHAAETEVTVVSCLQPYDVGGLRRGWAGLVQEASRAVNLVLHEQARAAREILERLGFRVRWIAVEPLEVDLLDFGPDEAIRAWEVGYVETRKRIHA